MTAADYARQSDPVHNRQFRRPWHEPPRRMVQRVEVLTAEATVLAWRDAWRAERAALRRAEARR